MEKGIVTLSFDDARKDTFHVFRDVLAPRNLPGVVYVPSGYIEISYNNPKEVGFNGLMTKEELDWIYHNPLFEIGCHGYMHRNDFDDLKKGVEKLQEWYPDYKKYGLASPHSEINKSFVDQYKSVFEDIGFEYVRGGRNFERCAIFKRGLSLIARKTKSPSVFVQTYKGSVNNGNDYHLFAVPIHRLTTLEQIKAVINYVEKEKYWAILEFHGIDTRDSLEYTEIYCWAEDLFTELCDYLENLRNNDRILMANPIDVMPHTEYFKLKG